MAKSAVLSSSRIKPKLIERKIILTLCEEKGITTSQALRLAIETGYATEGNRNFVKRVFQRKREIDQEEWRFWGKVLEKAEFPSTYHLKREIWKLISTEALKAAATAASNIPVIARAISNSAMVKPVVNFGYGDINIPPPFAFSCRYQLESN